MPATPSPGVSTVATPGNAATPIDGTRRKVVSPNAPPLGVTANRSRAVEEISLPVARASRYSAEYTSIDGETYTFRTHTPGGEPVPHRMNLCTFLAMREVALGGSPESVMAAFRVTIADQDGKPVFPITDESREAAMPIPVSDAADTALHTAAIEAIDDTLEQFQLGASEG